MNKLLCASLAAVFALSCAVKRKNASGDSNCADNLIPNRSLSIHSSLNLEQVKFKNQNALLTLEEGGLSLVSRLWLIEQAQGSIDIQYYSVANDVTGLLAYDFLLRAAERGVKVRILVDDAASRMKAHETRLLDAHANVEIRVYNAGLKLGRIDKRVKKLSGNINRVLRRMHNKALIVDGSALILGGRNIADEYFDHDKRYNFRDRDLLIVGPEAAAAVTSFNQYWESELTVTLEELKEKKKDKLSDEELYAEIHRCACNPTIFPQWLYNKIRAFPQTFNELVKNDEVIFTELCRFVADIPGKNEEKKNREGGICTDSILQVLRSARHTIVFNSPYLIVEKEDLGIFSDLTNKGVKIRILTNSLSSTDNHEAFSGYQRGRKDIIGTGIHIYEFKPDAEVRYKLMLKETQAALSYTPVFGLHSKTLVVDSEICVVASYNFDPRSANLNTECLAIIRSRKMASRLLKYMNEEFTSANAWQVSKDYNPDHEASLKKRLKVLWRRIIPKRIL